MIKNIYIKAFLISCIAILVGCQSAASFKDVILFTGTENSNARKFVVEGPESMGISITATDKVKVDTEVSIEVVPDLISDYNRKHGRNYSMPPSGSYELSSKKLTIKAGNAVSEPISLTLLSLDNFEEGAIYCIPISIISSTGDMSILEASRTMFVEIQRKLIVRAADLKGNNAFSIPSFVGSSSVNALNQVTMECRVLVHSFPKENSNPGISTLMGMEENFLLRFGDISIPKNKLQLAPGIVNGKKYFTTGNTQYATGRWYHVASVFDGSSIAIYVDGKLDVKFGTDPGTVDLSVDYMGMFWIGESVGGRRLNGAVSEARLWRKALTASQLEANMCFVDPTSEGLIAYWRFNDVQGDGTILDLTGNGHNAVPKFATIEWMDGVRCPE